MPQNVSFYIFVVVIPKKKNKQPPLPPKKGIGRCGPTTLSFGMTTKILKKTFAASNSFIFTCHCSRVSFWLKCENQVWYSIEILRNNTTGILSSRCNYAVSHINIKYHLLTLHVSEKILAIPFTSSKIVFLLI